MWLFYHSRGSVAEIGMQHIRDWVNDYHVWHGMINLIIYNVTDYEVFTYQITQTLFWSLSCSPSKWTSHCSLMHSSLFLSGFLVTKNR